MNSIDQITLGHFPDADKDAVVAIRKLGLRYLFRFVKALDLDELISEYVPDAPRYKLGSFRQSLTANGYLMLNIKQYLLEGAAKGYTYKNCKALKALAASVGVRAEDRNLGRHLRGTLLSELRDLTASYDVLSLPAWERSLAVMMESHAGYINRVVIAKLRFLSTSQSKDLSEFVSDINAYVLQRMYSMYPRFETPKHASNIIKQIVQQRVKNIIKEGTAEKRARLKATATGFESNTANIDSAMLSSETATQDSMCVGIEGDHRDESHFILKASVSHLISQYTGKKRLFLNLLMGEEHEGFSVWLRKKLNIKATSTNADWQERTDPSTYLQAVIKYLGICSDKVAAFLRKIISVIGFNGNPLIDVTPRTRPMF